MLRWRHVAEGLKQPAVVEPIDPFERGELHCLTDDSARHAQLLITMGCGEACPVVPGLRHEDWVLAIRKAGLWSK